MNTDEHRWESGNQVLPAGSRRGRARPEASECLSDLCSSVSICGSSLPARKDRNGNAAAARGLRAIMPSDSMPMM